jgi:hypothetical protein
LSDSQENEEDGNPKLGHIFRGRCFSLILPHAIAIQNEQLRPRWHAGRTTPTQDRIRGLTTFFNLRQR